MHLYMLMHVFSWIDYITIPLLLEVHITCEHAQELVLCHQPVAGIISGLFQYFMASSLKPVIIKLLSFCPSNIHLRQTNSENVCNYIFKISNVHSKTLYKRISIFEQSWNTTALIISMRQECKYMPSLLRLLNVGVSCLWGWFTERKAV